MKYLINRKTKEHKSYCPTAPFGFDWRIIQADSEGWISHNGTDCPLPDDARCELWWEGAMPFVTNHPQGYLWSECCSYRPILEDKPQESEPTEFQKSCIKALQKRFYPDPTPDNGPEQQCDDLLARLKSAHEAANEIPDLVAELRGVLRPMGYDLVVCDPLAEPDTDDRPRPTRRQQLIRAGIPAHEFDGIKKHKLNEPAGGSPAESLAEAFVWEDTPQGQEHWVKWESLLN